MLHFDLELEVFDPTLVVSLGRRLKMRAMPFFKVLKDWCCIVQLKKKKKLEKFYEKLWYKP